MQIFLETFLSLSPLYFFILVGILLRWCGVITDALIYPLNKLVFNTFLPVSLYISIYNSRLSFDEGTDAIGFAVVCYIIIFVILIITVPRFIKARPTASTVVQGLFRSNFALLGLAYATQLYGKTNIGIVSILIAILVPLFNILAVINFTLFRCEKIKLSTVLTGIIKNPLIIAAFLAFLTQLTKIHLPNIIYQPLDSLANIALPLSLIIVGASLSLQNFRQNGKLIISVTSIRLVILPCIFICIAILFGFRGITLIALFTAFAGPCAVSSPAMAYQMGGDGDLAGQLVVSTTVLSLPTMYLLIVLLRSLGFC